MQDCYERYRLSDYDDPLDAILHSIIHRINYKVQFHNHSYYEIFLVLSGGLYHEVNGSIQEVFCNSIVFIRPEDVHRYRQLNDKPCGLIRVWVSIQIINSLKIFLGSNSGFDRLLEEKLPVVLAVGKTGMQSFHDRFEAIFSLPAEDEAKRISSLKMLLTEIALLFTSSISRDKNQDLPSWLAELCNKMSRKDNFISGLDRLFELSPTSREHLSRCFKKYLGVTPTDYIKQLRLNYSANLLANTNKKITDVCYDSGFGNLSYFYQCFEQAYGVTPNCFRKARFSRIW